MNGLRLAAAYSVRPNELKHCGPDGAHKTLAQFVREPEKLEEEEIRGILRQFPVAMPYYYLIARANGIDDPFDPRVVEAYWLGNDLLKNVDEESVRTTIHEDVRREQWNERQIALMFSAIKLKQARPFHTLSVLYFFTFGKQDFSDEVKQGLDSCRVNAGRVVALGENLTVRYRPLEFESVKKVNLGQEVEKEIAHGFLTEVRIGDLVSFHLDSGVQILTPEQGRNLEHFTEEVLSAIY